MYMKGTTSLISILTYILQHIMRLYGYVFYVLVIFISQNSVITKSNFNSRFSERINKEDRSSYYPVKRKAPSPRPYPAAHEELPEVQYEVPSDSLYSSSLTHYRRFEQPLYGGSSYLNGKNYDTRPSRIERRLDLKRSAMDLNYRNERLHKRGILSPPLRTDSSYGIVYDNGRPLGILEPYPQAYDIAPISNSKEAFGEIQPTSKMQGHVVDILYPLSREVSGLQDEDNEKDESEGEGESINKFSDDNYPSVLTNYKMGKFKDTNQASQKIVSDRLRLDKRKAETAPKANEANMVETNPLEKREIFKNSQNSQSSLAESLKEGKSELKAENDAKMSTITKRRTGITDENIEELKQALNKIQNPEFSDNLEAVEENLRNILGEMGLIEDDKEIRGDKTAFSSKLEEDEDLENGANKIELMKDTHDSDFNERKKRDNSQKIKDSPKIVDSKGNNYPDSIKSEKSAVSDYMNNAQSSLNVENNAKLKNTIQAEADNMQTSKLNNEKNNEDELLANDSNSMHLSFEKNDESGLTNDKQEHEVHEENNENIENKRDVLKSNMVNVQSEDDAYKRSKRQGKETADSNKGDDSDLMKGLEKSGELTVSGNKSPLASSDGETDTKGTSQSSNPPGMNDKEMNKRDDELDYEKRLESNIQAKINEIKEEVKREIAALKAQDNIANTSKDPQRKKRDITNTLIDEEKRAPNPSMHSEEKLVPHLKRRRQLEDQKLFKRRKRDTEFENFKNTNSKDFLEIAKANTKRSTQDVDEVYEDNFQEPQDVKNAEYISDENVALNTNKEKNVNTIALKTEEQSLNRKDHYQDNAIENENDVKINSINEQNKAAEEISIDGKIRATKIDGNLEDAKMSTSVKEKQETNKLLKNKEQVKNTEAVEGMQTQDVNNLRIDINANSPLSLKSKDKGNKRNAKDSITENRLLGESNIEKQSTGNNNLAQLTEHDSSQVAEKNVIERKNRIIKEIDPLQSAKPLNERTPEQNVKENTDVNNNEADFSNSAFEKSTRRRRETIENNEDSLHYPPKTFYDRRKRANTLNSVAFVPYRSEDDEVDDEGDEFDDDGFDDKTSNLMSKRQTYEPNYQEKRELDYENAYDMPEKYQRYSLKKYHPDKKRHSFAHEYVADINSDVYENPSLNAQSNNFLYENDPPGYVRNKRQDFEQLMAQHGGGPTLNHLATIKERSTHQDDSNSRKKRNFRHILRNPNSISLHQPQQISDLSATDIFGALPQSYEGDLARFKRVKRSKVYFKKRG